MPSRYLVTGVTFAGKNVSRRLHELRVHNVARRAIGYVKTDPILHGLIVLTSDVALADLYILLEQSEALALASIR